MFISSLRDVKEPTYYSNRVGHEVSGVVAVLCECMGGYREGDMPRIGRNAPFAYHLALLCKSCRKKRNIRKDLVIIIILFLSVESIKQNLKRQKEKVFREGTFDA